MSREVLYSRERLAEVLRGMVLTEKATSLNEQNVYVFRVAVCASKHEILKAISHFFDVSVLRVNTLCIQPKNRKFKGRLGVVSGWKKAFVRLKKGDILSGFGGSQ